MCFEVYRQNTLDANEDNRNNGTIPKVVDPGIEETCSWAPDDITYFYDEMGSLHESAEEANRDSTEKGRTIELWQSVFGDAYSSTLTEAQENQRQCRSQSPSRERSNYPYTVVVPASHHHSLRGPKVANYPSDVYKPVKKQLLQFSIDAIDVPGSYEITWRVIINHRKEARDVDELRHETK